MFVLISNFFTKNYAVVRILDLVMKDNNVNEMRVLEVDQLNRLRTDTLIVYNV